MSILIYYRYMTVEWLSRGFYQPHNSVQQKSAWTHYILHQQKKFNHYSVSDSSVASPLIVSNYPSLNIIIAW